MVFLEDLEKELREKESPRKKPTKIKIEKKEELEEKEVKEFKFEKPKFYLNWNKIINRLLIFSGLIFLTSIIIFLGFNLVKKEPVKELKTNIFGPREVNSLEENIYTIEVNNYSSQYLTDVNLNVFLTDGIYFKDEDTKEKTFSLGNLEPNTSTKIYLNLNFINEGDKDEEIRVVLRYKIKNKPYVFEKEEKFSVLVKNPPIVIIPEIPSKVFVFQPIQLNFKIINTSKEVLKNFKIKIDIPKEFILENSLPPLNDKETEWFLGELKQGESQTVSLFGKFNDTSLYPFFYPKISFGWKDQVFVLTQKGYKINLLESPVSITIQSYPSSKSIYPGTGLNYTILIKNNSKITLRENIVKVTFNELFDLNSVNVSNGYYSTLDKAIYFNSRYEPKLLELNPGDIVKLNFSARLINSYPILGEKNKNFVSKVFVEFKTPSIPPEIREIFPGEYSLKIEDEKYYIGKYEITSFLVYKDNLFENSGPFPLVNEMPTTFSWYIKIKTIGEDFENFSFSGKLPPYVNFTGKVGGDTYSENFKFDNKNGDFSYNLNFIPANTGYQTKELELVFQIIVIPPANLSTQFLEIMPGVKYQISGSFTKTNFSGVLDEITANEIVYELK